tara:strand:+ start:11258 stop:11953 length:696 start_codon:yes stop_codon:yes gene_type:complete
MQPYLFPYLGYFNLIKACDKFVFLDDVNFIKKGWINRNYIILNNKPFRFSIPLIKSSQNVKINTLRINKSSNYFRKFKSTLYYSYHKSPYYENVIRKIGPILTDESVFISELAIKSIKSICSIMGIDKKFYKSSSISNEINEYEGERRLVEITKYLGGTEYNNLPGGKDLYSKFFFNIHGINLKFINPWLPEYQQCNNHGEFINKLSIIDILMNINPKEYRKIISAYNEEE